jgi:hypothetical protein
MPSALTTMMQQQTLTPRCRQRATMLTTIMQPQTLMPQSRQRTTDYDTDNVAVKQTKQMTDDNAYNGAATQTTGNKADVNDAAADVDAARQTTDNDAEDDTATQTTGNNEMTMMTQPQTLTPLRR